MRRTVKTLPSLVALLAPVLALAWTPYGYGPSGPTRSSAAEYSTPPAEGTPPAPGTYTPAETTAPESSQSPDHPPEPGAASAGSSAAPGYGSAYGPRAPYDLRPSYGDPGGYPYGPYGPGGAGYGYMLPPAAPHGSEAFGPPGGTAPRFGTQGPYGETPWHRGGRGGLQLSRSMTDEAYVLEIALEGGRPEAIQVEPRGRGLLITRDRSAGTEERDSFDEGRGFARRYSYSTGRMSRHVSVPPDGDLASLTREDNEDSIRILIPRRQD